MKAIIFIVITILILYVVCKSGDWLDSDNEILNKFGTCGCLLGIIIMILLNVMGAINFFKSCDDSGPSRDYYEAPRK